VVKINCVAFTGNPEIVFEILRQIDKPIEIILWACSLEAMGLGSRVMLYSNGSYDKWFKLVLCLNGAPAEILRKAQLFNKVITKIHE